MKDVFMIGDRDDAIAASAIYGAGHLCSSALESDQQVEFVIEQMIGANAVCLARGWEEYEKAIEVAKTLGLQELTVIDGLLVPRYFLIGLAGKAGSGKDYVAQQLIGLYDTDFSPMQIPSFLDISLRMGWQRAAFADSVKAVLEALNPNIMVTTGFGAGGTWIKPGAYQIQYLVRELKVPEQTLKKYTDIREYWQRLGTESGRNVFGKDVWINLAFSKLITGKAYIFTDVRFPNEIEAIRRYGGKVFWVEGPLKPEDYHESENSVRPEDCDDVIKNWDMTYRDQFASHTELANELSRHVSRLLFTI